MNPIGLLHKRSKKRFPVQRLKQRNIKEMDAGRRTMRDLWRTNKYADKTRAAFLKKSVKEKRRSPKGRPGKRTPPGLLEKKRKIVDQVLLEDVAATTEEPMEVSVKSPKPPHRRQCFCCQQWGHVRLKCREEAPVWTLCAAKHKFRGCTMPRGKGLTASEIWKK